MIQMPTFNDIFSMTILHHNIGQLLMFVMPILMIFLAIKYTGKFIEVVKRSFSIFNRRDEEERYDYKYDRSKYR